MSPMLIAALIIGGLAILISVGFINQAVERSRLERARAWAELSARLNHCVSIGAGLPGQFMSPDLRTQLLEIEASLLGRLVKLDGKNDSFRQHLEQVRLELSKGEPSITNPPLAISNEIAAQEAKRQLNELLRLFEQARRDGIIDTATHQHWAQELGRHIFLATLTMYQAIADEALRAGKPRVAKLQYERAIVFLGTQQYPDSASQLQEYRRLLVRAEQVVAHSEQAGKGSNELSSGVTALEQNDQAWKKKSIYDD